MAIFFPDNDNRKSRVIQLGSNSQQYLYQAETDYAEFMKLLEVVRELLIKTTSSSAAA
jgi:hypothetical protein